MTSKKQTLSEFLTARRASVRPEDVGISDIGPRRVPGLRREEVAVLSGVSVDWYVRLEQGRQVTPSESVLTAVARTLRLDDAEREYLFNLARPTSARSTEENVAVVRPGIRRMIDGFENQPSFLLGSRMEVLAGNELAWALLEDFPARGADDRNLLRWILTTPTARDLYLDWDTVASEMVGVLQLEASARPKDPAIAALVGELATASREFAAWWARPNPQGRTSGTKRFAHPVAGHLMINWEAFTVPDDSTQTLFVYSAADAASSEALRLLGAWRATEHAEQRPVTSGDATEQAAVTGSAAADTTTERTTH
ncbi:helix-turn-helix domain-containing protein [Cutibacterium avidum]|uniref:helix-turn-helix transcriptional regulator n=1 Tax=Cutibacterium avidum TaxID=33010 RepID=UPI00192CD21F|nr:helix-turn-helix transcriptional regulator [Cutibacterium avidum]QQY14216.1 helix-turn-helix domain-containing protein [Cutibacterium avidum]